MINGLHVLPYRRNAQRLRAFFRDVLGFRSVDAGEGWLIFALPPAELAFHPTDTANRCELYFMCNDVKATVQSLKRKGIACTTITDEGWGLLSSIKVSGAGEFGLYEPRHPLAIKLKPTSSKPRKKKRRSR